MQGAWAHPKNQLSYARVETGEEKETLTIEAQGARPTMVLFPTCDDDDDT